MRFDWCKTNLHPTCYDYTQDHCEGCNMMRAYLRGYETAQEKVSKSSEWISVGEKLPEDIKPVIITWKNTDPASYYQHIVGKHFIGTGHYCNGKWFWYSSVCEDLLAEYGKSDIDELDEAIEVIAWMPLPEPYKGGVK